MKYSLVIASTDIEAAEEFVSDLLGGDDDIDDSFQSTPNQVIVILDVDPEVAYQPSFEGKLNRLMHDSSKLVWWARREYTS